MRPCLVKTKQIKTTQTPNLIVLRKLPRLRKPLKQLLGKGDSGGVTLGLCRELQDCSSQVRAFHDVAAFNSSYVPEHNPKFNKPALGRIISWACRGWPIWVKRCLFVSPQKTSYNTMYTFLHGYEPRDSTTGFFIKPQAPAKTPSPAIPFLAHIRTEIRQEVDVMLCTLQGPCRGSTPVHSTQVLKRDPQFAPDQKQPG